MDNTTDDASDSLSGVLTGVDQMGEVQPDLNGLFPDVSSEIIPTADTKTRGSFLVTNWLVGEGEG
jgi:hypothetical protein